MATASLQPCSTLTRSTRLALNSSTVNRASKRQMLQAMAVYPGVYSKSKLVGKPVHSAGRWSMSLGKGNYPEIEPNQLSPSHRIEQFYACINNKNKMELGDFISDDCCFEDYSFFNPFRGRKEVIHFLEQLLECTGKNVKFTVESVYEGDQFTVGVMWHLEWKDKFIPFTRGSSFYECSKQGQRLVIKKARVMIESPIKPGMLSLTLLKMVRTLFDEFPKAAEGFLQKPQAIVQLLLKIYIIFLEPFVHPILQCYINVWKIVAQLLSNIFNILLTVSKIIFK
ncbi:PREDICTED: uncharacterized protein LOC104595980 [Nelumbo nucifera]|uniref:Uncharacterized protein LOC104595980 n=2 Tax=Nelumbo nucifera TaxID=4432 RepID=A0A1U7ZMC0_NELNU|nr:PREDICTED: uncharacterized protein LOC104595980 [Nelumbo nucifera]DAD19004.1 TPA_asm: hypothetical protein HUJ06_020467 [Nelumbo nucifera]